LLSGPVGIAEFYVAAVVEPFDYKKIKKPGDKGHQA
jgi:hypothetical protein